MRSKFAVALLFLLSAFLIVENYSFAQNREDYIITHEPSVNVRPCPRLTEECNAIYRLPAGTILRDGIPVDGDSYEDSDRWLRFYRDGVEIFIHSSLLRLAPPNSDLADAEQAHAWVALYNRIEGDQRNAAASVRLDLRLGANRLHVYVGGVDCSNSVRIFENVSTPLECNRPGEVWYLENIDRIHLIIEGEAEGDPEIELRCGRHNDSNDRRLIFACLFEEEAGPTTTARQSITTPTPGATPSHIEGCDDFEFQGTKSQRFRIFEDWLACEHGLDDDDYHALPDDESRAAIWWDFVELACGSDTSRHYWIIDFDDDWRCQQKAWPATEQPTLTSSQIMDCDDFEYRGTEDQRIDIFSEWLRCEHDMDLMGFADLTGDDRQAELWWGFVVLACGPDTEQYYWDIEIDAGWRCKREAWSDNDQPTPTPSQPPTSSCGPEALTGSVMNRIAIFERWLKCEHDLEYDAFWELPDDPWADIWWPFVEALCGADTASHYWDLDSDTWQCEQVPWDDHSACGPVELTGTRINRILIFEQWLTCEHDMDYMTFLDTLNEDRQDDIWWEFIRVACGPDKEEHVWYLDEDWQCQEDELGQDGSGSA